MAKLTSWIETKTTTPQMTQHVYFARMRTAFSPGFLPFDLHPGDEIPVNTGETLLRPETDYSLMKRDCIGIYNFTAPRQICTLFAKNVMSRFVIGDIVKKRGTDCVFRIYAVKWDRVDFWYQDAWGESQSVHSGSYESDLMLATEHEIDHAELSIRYYDDLMARRTKFQMSVKSQ